MEQRDHLKKQIDLLGRVLGKILSDLLGLKNTGQLNTSIEAANEIFSEKLNLDLQNLLKMPMEELIETLKQKNNFTNENIEQLADILLILADNNSTDAKRLYEKSLHIFEYLKIDEKTFSFERNFKMKKIKKLI